MIRLSIFQMPVLERSVPITDGVPPPRGPAGIGHLRSSWTVRALSPGSASIYHGASSPVFGEPSKANSRGRHGESLTSMIAAGVNAEAGLAQVRDLALFASRLARMPQCRGLVSGAKVCGQNCKKLAGLGRVGMRGTGRRSSLLALSLCLGRLAAKAPIAVPSMMARSSGRRPGRSAQDAQPYTVALIDMRAKQPKILARDDVPGSVVGPPLSVAVSVAQGGYRARTSARRIDPSDPTRQRLPTDRVSVSNLTPLKPGFIRRSAAWSGGQGSSTDNEGESPVQYGRGRPVLVIHQKGRATIALWRTSTDGDLVCGVRHQWHTSTACRLSERLAGGKVGPEPRSCFRWTDVMLS